MWIPVATTRADKRGLVDQFTNRGDGYQKVVIEKFTFFLRNRMRNIAIAVVATTMLGACGFMTPAKQYAGDTQSVSGFATVKGHMGIPFSGEFHATITGFTKLESSGSSERKTFGIAGFTDYPKEIQVLAGEYSVHVYCFRGLSSYRPSTTQSLEAGKTYLLKCNMRDGQAIVSVQATAS